VEGKHIPEVPTALLWFVRWLPIVSGAPPPSLWAIFIMPLHGIRHRQLRRQWLSSACRHEHVGEHTAYTSLYERRGVLKLLIKLVNCQLKLYICKEKEKNMSEGNNIVLIVPEGNTRK
jgi:hypothetical protein